MCDLRFKKTFFNGLVIRLESKQDLGETVFKSKNKSSIINNQKFEMNIEDFNLNKYFDISSNRYVENLVDSSLLKKIGKLNDRFSISAVDLIFAKNFLYILISTDENFFEIKSVNKKVYDLKNYEKVILELASIFNLTDCFDGENKK